MDMDKDNSLLIPNRSYGDFALGLNIQKYLSREHTREVYEEATFTNISYYFYNEDITVWCDADGVVNTIICSSSCIYHGKNLIGMRYDDFRSLFSKEPDNEDLLYMLVAGRGQNQHVYDFDTDGLQVWVWRKRVRTILIYRNS